MTQRIGRILRPGGAPCAARRGRSSGINLNGALARGGRAVGQAVRRALMGAGSGSESLKRKRRGCPRRLLLLIRRFGAGHQPRLISGGGAIIGTISGCSIQRRPILKSQELVLLRLKEAPGHDAVFWQKTTAVCGEPR